MAKKSSSQKTDRSDPRSNKSLAIRTVLGQNPNARAAEIAGLVKSEFGHNVSLPMIYMIKTKINMKHDGRKKRGTGDAAGGSLSDAASWVDAIKLARNLLRASGSVANASALLKALDAE